MDLGPLVKAIWSTPPVDGRDGDWYATWAPCTVPLNVALIGEADGRCQLVRVDGAPVLAR